MWLEAAGYEGLLLNRRDNYAWITGGCANHVVTNGESGVAHYAVTKDKAVLFADSSDLPRMNREQNPLGAEPIMVPWYESVEEAISQYISGKKFASDTGIAGTNNVQETLMGLRMLLTEEEVERYKQLGRACANIVEGVCREVSVGDTEEEIAARVKCRCIQEGISPDCVLVGADERILDYRHPMPTKKQVRKALMVTLGGERQGLNISITRFVYFDGIPEEIRERYERTQYVFACMQLMMREGMTYGHYFEKVKELYREVSYDGEWKLHHQGGPTGYACREFTPAEGNREIIHEEQAYAWNPTIAGTKCEETTYLTSQGIQIFTDSGNWTRKEITTPYGCLNVAEILEK